MKPRRDRRVRSSKELSGVRSLVMMRGPVETLAQDIKDGGKDTNCQWPEDNKRKCHLDRLPYPKAKPNLHGTAQSVPLGVPPSDAHGSVSPEHPDVSRPPDALRIHSLAHEQKREANKACPDH